jgi:hypothetical protein
MRNAQSYNAPASWQIAFRLQIIPSKRKFSAISDSQETFKALYVMMTEIMRVAIILCYRRWWLNITYDTKRPSFLCGVMWRRLAVSYWRFGQPFEPLFEDNTVQEVFYCLTVEYRAHRRSRNIGNKLTAYVAAVGTNLAEYSEIRSLNELHFCVFLSNSKQKRD